MKALLLLLALPLHAELRETRTFADLVPAVDTNTLVVVDIDNTTLEPVGAFGSDQWYYYLAKTVGEDKAGEAWTAAQKTVKVKPVEPITPDILKGFQKKGVKVMALTARGAEDEAATFSQLKSVGVDYSANPPTRKELKTEDKGLFKNGVFFQGEGPSKGATLVAFIKKLGLKPGRVVFIDDKEKHAKSVEQAVREAGIPVISFRYGATDQKVKYFNDLTEEFDLTPKGR